MYKLIFGEQLEHNLPSQHRGGAYSKYWEFCAAGRLTCYSRKIRNNIKRPIEELLMSVSGIEPKPSISLPSRATMK